MTAVPSTYSLCNYDANSGKMNFIFLPVCIIITQTVSAGNSCEQLCWEQLGALFLEIVFPSPPPEKKAVSSSIDKSETLHPAQTYGMRIHVMLRLLVENEGQKVFPYSFVSLLLFFDI